MTISLTGFMGCGKSSVGRRLSALLSCSYADLDSVIEQTSGRTIPEIFASDGEAAFRQMELDALMDMVAQPGKKQPAMILALGGGTVMTPECAAMVHEHTVCIYLRASVDTLVCHLQGETEGRPMLESDISGNPASRSEALRQRITELMDMRSGTYEKTAHIIIDTDGKSIDRIATEIRQSLSL